MPCPWRILQNAWPHLRGVKPLHSPRAAFRLAFPLLYTLLLGDWINPSHQTHSRKFVDPAWDSKEDLGAWENCFASSWWCLLKCSVLLLVILALHTRLLEPRGEQSLSSVIVEQYLHPKLALRAQIFTLRGHSQFCSFQRQRYEMLASIYHEDYLKTEWLYQHPSALRV